MIQLNQAGLAWRFPETRGCVSRGPRKGAAQAKARRAIDTRQHLGLFLGTSVTPIRGALCLFLPSVCFWSLTVPERMLDQLQAY